jgi:hypothetical protein
MLSPSSESKNTSRSDSARYPRRTRMAGFMMSTETATAWASRLSGRDLHPYYDSPSVWKIICDKVRPYRSNFGEVGEVSGVNYMVITQSARFQGYKDMEPSLIPLFAEGEREAIARKLLEEEGVLYINMNCIPQIRRIS